VIDIFHCFRQQPQHSRAILIRHGCDGIVVADGGCLVVGFPEPCAPVPMADCWIVS
jgi:hypothetical protein